MGDEHLLRVAEFLREGFRLVVPFESRDIGITSDRLRVERPGLTKGESILVVYDQTYGSLRLSSKLLEEGVLARALDMAARLAGHALDAEGPADSVLPDVQRVLSQLAGEAARTAATPAWTETAPPPPVPGERGRVILEGSQGICVLHGNREMKIQQVYYSPRGGLQYKGRLSSDNSWETHLTVVPVEGVQPIPGLSVMGWYDLDLGELIADEPE